MKINKRKVYAVVIYCLAAVFCALFLVSVFFENDLPKPREMEPIADKFYINKEQASLPCVVKTSETSKVSLTATIRPSAYQNSVVFFKTTGTYVTIICDKNVIYSFSNSKETTNEFGTKWHSVPLKNSYLGKELEIQFSKPTPHASFTIPVVYLTTNHIAIKQLALSSIFSTLLALIAMLMGIALLLLSLFFFPKKGYRRRIVYYLGFCLTATVFSLTNTPLAQYLIGAPHLLYIVNCFSYSLVAIFSFLYFYALIRPAKKFLFMGLLVGQIAISITIFTTLILSIPTNIAHIQYFLTMPLVVLLYTKLIEMMRSKQKHALLLCLLSTAIVLLVITNMVLENFMVFDNSYIFELMILFTIVPLTVTVKKFATTANEAIVNERLLKAIVYKDSLTSIYNRKKFDEDIISVDIPQNTYLVVFDINNLKVVNDTLGHLAGDKLIQSAAKIISESFKNVGAAYRIGGDEFAVIIKKQASDNINTSIKEFTKASKANNVSIAYAINKYDPECDSCMTDLFERVDKFMYIQKQKMKEGA